MKVELKLFASLKKNYPSGLGEDHRIELEPGTTIGRVLDVLGIKRETAKIILRNGRHAVPGDVLDDGDRLAVFPPIAGG